MLHFEFDGRLFALSIAIASVASYSALTLATHLAVTSGRERQAWLASSAGTMGLGIWSMHFTGMLALRMDMPMGYHLPTLLLSLLVAIAGSGISFERAGRGAARTRDLALASLAMALAILGMHFLGMAAMRMPARVHYDRGILALAATIAIVAAASAQVLVTRRGHGHVKACLWARLASALLMGAAIYGTHYTAVAAARLIPQSAPTRAGDWEVLATPELAGVVIVATLVILAVVLVALWTDRHLRARLAVAEVLVTENARLLEEARLARCEVESRMAELDVANAELAETALAMARARTIAEALEAEQRALVGAMRDVILVLDIDGRYVKVPQTAPELLFRPAPDLVGKRMHDVMPAEAADDFLATIRRALATRSAVRMEYDLGVDDDIVSFSGVVSPLSDDQVVWVARDVTEQRRGQDALRASEERLRMILHDVRDVVFRRDVDGVWTFLNPAWAELTGWSVEESLGRSCLEFVHADDRALDAGQLEALHRGEKDSTFYGVRLATRDGRHRWIEVHGRAVRDAAGAVVGTAGILSDCTERRQAEEALRESEALLRESQRIAHVGSWVSDVVANQSTWSDEVFRILGHEPGAVTPSTEAFLARVHADDLPSVVASIEGAHLKPGRFSDVCRIVRPDGTIRRALVSGYVVVDGSGHLTRMVGTIQDNTEHWTLEAQLRQAQKMEAVGRLAGGVAHDFNNLLTVITSYTAMLLNELPTAGEIQADLVEVQRAAERAAALTRQLLAFSRQQVLQPRRLDVNAVVTDVAGMLRRVINEDIILQTELTSGVWPVHADPGQLEHVLMNLAVNARDAMPQGGTLRLRTTNLTVEANGPLARRGIAAGQYAAFLVEDTGTGIDPAVVPQIFEPFYTTKEVGMGTGLGLAMAQGIVEQSGGCIYVDTALGEGTCFTVLLPRQEAPADVETAAAPPVPARGTETILLVEDESALRAVVRRMLERQGYKVLEAGGASEALRIAASEGRYQQPDVVLTDIVMPEQNGHALGKQLLAYWPEVKVLYMSGYTNDEILRRGLGEAGTVFLEKPFSLQRLSEAVRQALDGSAVLAGDR